MSIIASLLTLGLKSAAYFFSGSIGLLSDALESVVNLVAGTFATVCLTIANKPPDRCHQFGHGKIEYFSGGVEGLLIIGAAFGIAYASIDRIITPIELGDLGVGLLVAVIAAAVNFFTAQVMLRAAKHFDSLILEADAKHLMTDVWTSVGMVAGLGVMLLGTKSLYILDPIVAIVMSLRIVYTGIGLVRTAAENLMDGSLPESEIKTIHEIIYKYKGYYCTLHAFRTRKSGAVRFIEFHLLTDGSMSVKLAHDLVGAIEQDIVQTIPDAKILVHVEPFEDHPTSLTDR
ncbi:MAG: cation transporter [Deltaproteobacteria bacterium]|nr:cation transporter [Deltaproteobacteria bacterium]